MARRSARLSNRNSSTPQPTKSASLAHDDYARIPRTLPTKLRTLKEVEDLPGSFPQSPSEITADTPSKNARASTPEQSAVSLPSKEEMHPQAHHKTTEEKHADARWLGFSNLEPKSEPAREKSSIPRMQMTPSKATGPVETAMTPVFQFTFNREQSFDLSPAAKKMMEEKRDEASRMKEQMRGEGDKTADKALMQRRIATPKSHRGRYSDAHSQQFQKMDSIAGHASAFRKDPARLAGTQQATSALPSSAIKSLKRSPSKAELDTQATPSKSACTTSSTQRSARTASVEEDQSSPRKRTRHEVEINITPARSSTKAVSQHTPSRLPQLTTPTKSSLARTASIKSLKSLKPSGLVHSENRAATPMSTTLLSKSPARASIFSSQKPSELQPHLLARSPLKLNGVKSPTMIAAAHEACPESPLLARSATKFGHARSIDDASALPGKSSATPLLAQTPTRVGLNKQVAGESHTASTGEILTNRFNLLRATPIKSILRTPQRLYSDDPAKVAAGTHLATPPQLAHLKGRMRAPATAPVQKHVDFSSSTKAREASKGSIGSHFTAGGWQAQRATTEVTLAALAPITYPSLDDALVVEPKSTPRRRQSGSKHDFTFRVGSEIVFAPDASPPKQRAISHSPAGFTIRAVVDEPCGMGARPIATATGTKKRKMDFENAQSVVEVEQSPTVTLGSKKRKFDFENEMAEKEADTATTQDKENIPIATSAVKEQPTKRVKISQSHAVIRPQPRAKSAPAEAKKRTTLGVKPKALVGKSPVKTDKKKNGSTISMARLNALAMPKKRAE